MSFIASIHISARRMVKEGDLVEIPAYSVFGFVKEISLNLIKVENLDKTITHVPTQKMMDISLHNYRNIIDNGIRRLQKKMYFDIESVRFFDSAKLKNLEEKGYLSAHINEDYFKGRVSSNITNMELFLRYSEEYLKKRKDVKLKGNISMVRINDMDHQTVPMEIYLFIKVKGIMDFEEKHAEIMLHLLTVSREFGLKPKHINIKKINSGLGE